MGANQSSRKITVVNDEATGVIKISDAVVNRLKGEIEGTNSAKEKQEKAAPEPAAPVSPPQEPPKQTPPPPPTTEPPPPPPREEPAPPPPPKSDPPPPPAVEAPSETSGGSTASSPQPAEAAAPQASPHVWQRPIIQYIEEPSLSALKVRQEKEEEMKTLEEYWMGRLQKQQEEHVNINKLTEEEVSKGVKSVEKLFAHAGSQPVCREESNAVQSCYQTHPGQSLRCRENVKSFMACVSNVRLSSG